jgi:membrane-bound ClpP family serine protease
VIRYDYKTNLKKEIFMKYLVLISLLMACSSPSVKLTEKAKEIEVHDTKPTQCRVIAKVEGTTDEGSRELALNRALNEAAEKGANALFINQEVPNGNKIDVYATAYDCKED